MDLPHGDRVLLKSFSCLTTIILLLGSVLPLLEVGGHEIDRLALLEFKTRIADPGQILSSWNDTSHICKWYGVTCGRRHHRVTILDLHSKNLRGSVPPHIGNLSFLREVHLQNNSFHYEIPSQFGLLFRLQKLSLNDNSFSGQMPSNISHCSNLLVLDLSRNMLEGNLPTELSFLSKLQNLVLDGNSLTGNISPLVGNLSSLQTFSILSNSLSGTIPEIFSQLRNLNDLSLGGNNFVGMIPISIFNISTMIIFDVSENQLEGGLPSKLGFTLPNLQIIFLNDNHLTGLIPESISNVSNLSLFQICSNNFTGKVPSFSNMRGLLNFNIENNNFGSGQSDDLDFLCSFTDSTNLRVIVLGHNAFGGPIPDCIGNLSTALSVLWLKVNHISGALPFGIGNLINLEIMELSYNNISGNIPFEIGNLNKMNVMVFSHNNFLGQIPESIGNLRMLTKLHLNGNNFQGSIPSSLGNCQNILLLDLSSNNLNGNISPKIVNISSLSIYLNLSQNSLTGSIPREVGNLRNLGELSLNGNRLSQQIPSSIGSCTSMERLYVQDNFFEGPLPSTMSSMRGLQVLNVSNNRLSGQIPKYIASLNLTNLSLSYNDFEGALPTGGIFGSAISTLVVGNKKLCGGLPDFQLPKCDYKESKQRRIRGTAKVLISIVSALVGVASILSLLYFFWFRYNKKAFASSSFKDGFLHVSYHSLLKATGGFSSTNLLGVGNFGSVYRGLLDQTQLIVAIKILDLTCHGASKSFEAECKILRGIRHRNLVKVGHLGDFGLARFLPEAMHKLLANQSSSIGLKGSFGYIAPEYGRGSTISAQGDVYSFGVLILEMFTGKRPTDDMFENGLDLHHFGKATLGDRVEKVIDPILLQEIEESNKRQRITSGGKTKSWSSIQDCLASIIKIGVTCSSQSPRERMDISDALTKLQGIRKKFLDFIVIV